MTTPAIHCPTPQRSLKRQISHLDEDTTCNNNKRQRVEQFVCDWLYEVPTTSRPRSIPPNFRPGPVFSIALANAQMSQQIPLLQGPRKVPTPAPSVAQTVTSAKIKTDDVTYPGVLKENGIIMDRSGRRIPADIKDFVDEHIRNKRRSSPPLAQAELDKTIEVAEFVTDKCENTVQRLLQTAMFPLWNVGISEGGDVLFSTEPIPDDPDCFYSLSTPKPDKFFGYDTGQGSDFGRFQNKVIGHPCMVRYAQPAADTAFPFLVIEVKSEARGGTLWHAENQAAGSGSHCVNGMRWLLQHAEDMDGRTTVEPEATKTIAFSICLNASQAKLYVHSYSANKQAYLMSRISSFSTTEEKDVQNCRNQIKNIMDFAVGLRRGDINKALDSLWPLPRSWSAKKLKQRDRSPVSSTPATSFTGQIVGKIE